MRKCKLCEESIPDTANKCSHCQGFQNWRRHLDFGNTLLSLFIAFFTVLALTVPIVKKSLTDDNSDISVNYIDRSDVSVPIVVTNEGSRPGIMQPGAGLKLTIKDDKGQYHEHILILRLPSSRKDLLIPKESTKQFFFFVTLDQPINNVFSKLEQDWNSEKGGLLNLKKCTIIGSYIDFKGQDKKYEFTIYDSKKTKHYDDADDFFDHVMGVEGCRIKLPQEVRNSTIMK